MRVRVTRPIKIESNRGRKRRDRVGRGYHKRAADGWERLEYFAAARKQKHLERLEQLEKKIAKDIAEQEKTVAKMREKQEKEKEKAEQHAKTGTADSRSKRRVTANA